MSLVNINPNVEDVHYRYKRPQIQVKFEHAHGASTRVTNLTQVAAALVVNLSKKTNATADNMRTHILKALQKQMGVMAILSSTKDPIFKGHIAPSRFEAELNKWVVKNILCPKCSSPEYVKSGCPACGYEKLKVSSSITSGYVVEVEAEDSKVSLEQCDRLHKLYDLRPNQVVDRAIDRIWKSDDSKWAALRKQVDELINEITQHNTIILCTEDVSKRLKSFLSQTSQIHLTNDHAQFVDFPHVTYAWSQQVLLETLDQVLEIATEDGRYVHVPRGFPYKKGDKVTKA